MKKLLLVMIVSILLNNLVAQDYYPFDTTLICWNELKESGDDLPDHRMIESYFISGDTLITNYKFFKIYKIIDNDSIYMGAFRESNKKILYVGRDYFDFTSDTSVVLYDFTKNVDDTVHTGSWHWAVICEIDSILISGIYRKRYTLNDNQYWIEGIGSTNGFFFPITEQPTMYWHSELICFNRNNNIIYLNPNFIDCTTAKASSITDLEENDLIHIYPNPSNFKGEINIKSEGAHMNRILIFNALGYLVESSNCISKRETKIDISDYLSGIYVIKIIDTNEKVYYQKFVVNGN